MSDAGGGFADQVRTLIAAAARVYALTPGQAGVASIAKRMEEPLRVAIAGRVKAGKSTLLNALVGEELAPTAAEECTRTVWWFRDGITYRVIMQPVNGPSRPLRFSRDGGALDVDLEGVPIGDLDRLEIEWPTRALRTMTLIDTPGMASATAVLGETAQRFLAPDDGQTTDADAVVYLMRHLHSADVRFLESFQDDVQATPINTIAVLSRADELGVGRVDAMVPAARIAERYRTDRKLRRVSQAVVPLAGLLAQASVTLRESDYRLLRQLQAMPAVELDELLMSVDRFCLLPSPVPPGDRAALLHRFGIFGVRVALKFIGDGAGANAASLATALMHESGLDDLRALLASQFTARRDLLKGRAALQALEALVSQFPVPGSEVIDAEVERILAGAHELAEIRLLNALRSGAVDFGPAVTAEAERLLGTDGAGLHSRLGLDPHTGDSTVAGAVKDALARWQRRAENPLAAPEAVEAAQVVVRTCEGLAASLATRPSSPPD